MLAPPPPPPPQLTSFILTTILISFYVPTSLSQQQFEPNCANLYSCGQNIQRIGYPFWGQNRNPNCGLPGFQLNCLELVQDNTTTIVINSQIYRVLEINQNDHTITIARHNVCPVVSTDRTLNDTLFGYDSDQVQFLDLYYSCPSLNIPTRDTIRCSGNGNTDTTGFYLNETFSSADVQACEISVGVPVNRTLFREFEESERISLQELMASGVRVEYKYDVGACLKCEESDGFCWSGTNTSVHSCLCRDGIRFGDCSARSRPLIGVKITVGLVCGGGSIACIILYFYCRKSSFIDSLMFWKSTKNDNQIEAFITQYGFSTPKRYKFFEIKKMTNSFKDELGKGGFGSVFKGMLQDGSLVAVKVLKESKGNGEEFINEVASIGRTSHVNIVALLGFCYEGKKRALVYEFMPNGSLEKFINHNVPKEGTQQHLGVEKLFEIAVGIARGLEYLHRGCTTRILHFDIKPHNILLNKHFCPKISDFGLAKIHSREESIMSMVEARGTIGYIAPEVFNRNFGGVSHKSDVYSYGMMVLEMVGGRKNIITRPNHSSEIYFPQWIYKQLELEEDLRMPIMENEIARKMIIVGLWCIQPNPTERPSIRKVVEMLEGTIDALQIPPNPIFSPPPHLPVTSSIILESSISFE